jgi:hypothetical protein
MADYDQCATSLGQCANALTACNAALSPGPDISEACRLIDDLVSDSETLQGEWGFLKVALMFSDDISVSDWSATDFAIVNVGSAVSALQRWARSNC